MVKRKRLHDRLDQIGNCRVIMVTAPAGYGKTAFISSWASGKKGQTVTWLTLDEEDNEEELFWSYFLLSFYRNEWVPEEMKQRADAMLRQAVSFSRLHLTYFINDLTEIGKEATMVLDDFGAIRSQKVINDLAYLIRYLPSHIHLVLSGREQMDIGLAKYKAAGEVLELTREELAFTQEETVSFFRNAAQISLTGQEYADISSVFEGWIAGMQLMALTVKNAEAFTLPRPAENQYIYAYLMEEVICGLEDGMKYFLIQTSFLERFCPQMCDDMFLMDNAGAIIRRLESLNMFLICLDREEGWFRYHKLFRDFLQTLPFEKEENSRLSIYRKAAVWHEKRTDWKEAIHYAIKGGDYEKAVSMIETIGSEIGCKGESGTLHRWNQYLPAEIVENNIRLLLNSAWACAAEGKAGKLQACIKKIRKFEPLPVQMQAEMTALCSSNLPGTQAELDAIFTECRQALTLLTPREFLWQLLCFNIGSILLQKGLVKESLSYFEQCHRNSMEAGNHYLAVISKKAIMTAGIRNGQLQTAEQEILDFLEALADMGGEVLPASGLLYAQLAEIYYWRNELPQALTMAKRGCRYGELGEDMWTAGENYLMLEKIYRAMDQPKQYGAIREKALLCLKGRKYFDLDIRFECFHILTLLSEGKLTVASRRISALKKVITPELAKVYPEFAFIKARFYENKGDLEKAGEILLSLKEEAIINGQKGGLCEAQLLLAVIYEKAGQSRLALHMLEAAISLAEGQGCFQPFLNEGKIVEKMLKRITGSIFTEGLLSCFKIQPSVTEGAEGLLSGRETEILALVAAGAGNEEIAHKLFISKNTVKTHLLNIYAKLDVHNRTGAVARAEELNLLRQT